ncbi:MAG TPA: HDOD domain-containing protein [Phycisphaerae bacterium]|nr:HDOD domain-containing protein [Phycisphaerae bacterium]
MIGNPTRGEIDSIESLCGVAALLGRSRIACLSNRLYASPPPGPVETASVLALSPALSAGLIRIANAVRHGAGIPALNIEAATVRLGTDRTRALAVAFECAQALCVAVGDAIDFGAYWRQGLIRGCVARALAMNTDRRLASEAFLVGLLQDVGSATIAAAQPREIDRLRQNSEGCPVQLAALEWQSFGLNHIHVGLELLRQWQLPAIIVDAVGRHHTNPPLSPANSPAMRLWQIAYVAGALPIGPSAAPPTNPSLLLRLLHSAFNIHAGRVAALIEQAADEYRDIESLFARYFTAPISVADLLGPATMLAMDAASPLDVVPASHPVREFARREAPLSPVLSV